MHGSDRAAHTRFRLHLWLPESGGFVCSREQRVACCFYRLLRLPKVCNTLAGYVKCARASVKSVEFSRNSPQQTDSAPLRVRNTNNRVHSSINTDSFNKLCGVLALGVSTPSNRTVRSVVCVFVCLRASKFKPLKLCAVFLE